MVRIFVCTSQINALYMILYARKTVKPGYRDILVLDSVSKRKALIQVLINTKKIYDWSEIIDLSIPIDDEKEIAPGFRKKFTRRIKTNPLVKPIYDILLKGYLKKKQQAEGAQLLQRLQKFPQVHELNMLTQTMVNNTLQKLYPQAVVNYFEHGIGDYLFVQEKKHTADNFYCVFAEPFRKFLAAKNNDNVYVKDLLEKDDFQKIATEVLDTDEQKQTIISSVHVEGKKVIILLDSMEIYQVPDSYWTDYLNLCIGKVKSPENYTFVLKPHHNQAQRSIKMSKDHIAHHHKLKVAVVENNLPVNYSIEVLFAIWKDSTDYVFSTFSSGLFYISKMYYDPNVKYYYAYDFFSQYTRNAPVQFVEIYNGIKEIVKEVLAEKCTDISPR